MPSSGCLGTPFSRHRYRLLRSRPRRHGHTHRRECTAIGRTKLEIRPHRNRDADAGFKRDDFLTPIAAAPHFSVAGQHEPDLIHGAMTNRRRSVSAGKLEMCHAAALRFQQHAHVRTVGRNDIGFRRQMLRFEIYLASFMRVNAPALFAPHCIASEQKHHPDGNRLDVVLSGVVVAKIRIIIKIGANAEVRSEFVLRSYTQRNIDAGVTGGIGNTAD